jgi:hypothetical protein
MVIRRETVSCRGEAVVFLAPRSPTHWAKPRPPEEPLWTGAGNKSRGTAALNSTAPSGSTVPPHSLSCGPEGRRGAPAVPGRASSADSFPGVTQQLTSRVRGRVFNHDSRTTISGYRAGKDSPDDGSPDHPSSFLRKSKFFVATELRPSIGKRRAY